MPYTFFRFIERTKINAVTDMYHINAYALEGIKEGIMLQGDSPNCLSSNHLTERYPALFMRWMAKCTQERIAYLSIYLASSQRRMPHVYALRLFTARRILDEGPPSLFAAASRS